MGTKVSTVHQGSLLSTEIVSLGLESLAGLYAPLTQTGTMLVDGVRVSCYADVLLPHWVANGVMADRQAKCSNFLMTLQQATTKFTVLLFLIHDLIKENFAIGFPRDLNTWHGSRRLSLEIYKLLKRVASPK